MRNLLPKLLRYLAGVLLAVAGVWVLGHSGTAGLIYALPIILASAFCLFPLIADPLGNAASGFFYSGKAAPVPEQLSQIHALVSNGRHEEALVALDELLAARPRLVEARLFRIRLLYDHLHRPAEASALALHELTANPWHRDCGAIAMMVVDDLLARGEPAAAAIFLRDLLPRVSNASQRRELEQRLNAIET